MGRVGPVVSIVTGTVILCQTTMAVVVAESQLAVQVAVVPEVAPD